MFCLWRWWLLVIFRVFRVWNHFWGLLLGFLIFPLSRQPKLLNGRDWPRSLQNWRRSQQEFLQTLSHKTGGGISFLDLHICLYVLYTYYYIIHICLASLICLIIRYFPCFSMLLRVFTKMAFRPLLLPRPGIEPIRSSSRSRRWRSVPRETSDPRSPQKSRESLS